MGVLKSVDIMAAAGRGRRVVSVTPGTVITPLARETAEIRGVEIREDIMRRPFIAGNWKMNKTNAEAVETAERIRESVKEIGGVDVLIAPPFTALAPVREVLKGSEVKLGAQNLHHEKSGAFTGEVSAGMLLSAGCGYVIVGHSERREYFGCTDEIVNMKTRAALEAGLNPIVCVGELLSEREENRTFDVLKRQITGGLKDLPSGGIGMLTLAYEPVWAIGTGRTATPAQAQEAHRFIRETFSGMYGEEVSSSLRILYGGSVKPGNIAEIMEGEDVDGALVGGASLDPDSFAAIAGFRG